MSSAGLNSNTEKDKESQKGNEVYFHTSHTDGCFTENRAPLELDDKCHSSAVRFKGGERHPNVTSNLLDQSGLDGTRPVRVPDHITRCRCHCHAWNRVAFILDKGPLGLGVVF